MLALNEFAAKLKMPTQLYFKIRRILERNAASSNFNLLDQETLLNELPAALKSEVTQHTHQKILNSFSFFKGKPPQFVADILPEFQHISLGKDEVIYRKGEWVEDSKHIYICRNIFIYSIFPTERASGVYNKGWIYIQKLCEWVLFW